jgi:hypothetical protein
VDSRLEKARAYRADLAERIRRMPEEWPEREVLLTYRELAEEKCRSLEEERRRVLMQIEDERARKELGV